MVSIEILKRHASDKTCDSREKLWAKIVSESQAKSVLEVGVWQGSFAQHLLRQCPLIGRYYMLDPWRHLDQWNKPANVEQSRFDAVFDDAMSATDFAKERRVVLRGTTAEKIESIEDGSLDLAYIDGDHTLRGISIDLIKVFPKIKSGGVIGGDDYTTTIWQHSEQFEPSLVCPFAAYFAESQNAPLIILPHSQFAIIKPADARSNFCVIDTTGKYREASLLWQIQQRPS
jgi:predicted O-methyltransferase YrrM